MQGHTLLTTKGFDHKTPIRTSFDQRCNHYSYYYCRGTPGTIQALGVALILGAVASVVYIPDDSTSLIALQTVLAGSLGAGAVASLAGASLLSDLQDA